MCLFIFKWRMIILIYVIICIIYNVYACTCMFAEFWSNKHVFVFVLDFKDMGLQLRCRIVRELEGTPFCLDIQVCVVL